MKKAVHDLGIDFPVAIDNRFTIWRAFNNEYWPAHYFVDAQARAPPPLRRRRIRGIGARDPVAALPRPAIRSAERADRASPVRPRRGVAAADSADVRSPETYAGYARAEDFMSPGGVVRRGVPLRRAGPARSQRLGPRRHVAAERATLAAPAGRIVYRFHARDLHLVLGPGEDGKPVRFRVTLDGAAPGTRTAATSMRKATAP